MGPPSTRPLQPIEYLGLSGGLHRDEPNHKRDYILWSSGAAFAGCNVSHHAGDLLQGS